MSSWLRPIMAGWLGLGASGALAQGWGEHLPWTNTYEVYVSNMVYGAEPLKITDTRVNPNEPWQYANKTNFEIRSVDVFRPAIGAALISNAPVVFFVHGGAWVDEYRDWYSFVAKSFSGEKGWTTVVVDYRLTSTNVFLAGTTNKAAWYPDNIGDVAGAFRWIVEHIGAQGGDPGQIVALGHSAGGHLVALLATHAQYADLRSSLQAVVSMSGIYIVSDMSAPIFGGVIEQTWHGGLTNLPALAEGSPDTYLAAGLPLPPFYVLYCSITDDLPGFWQQGVDFTRHLNDLGLTVTNDMVVGYNHVSEVVALGDTNELPTRLIIRYIEQRLSLANLSAPAGVTAGRDGTSAGALRIAWSAAPKATSYAIWRSLTPDTNSAENLGLTTATVYIDANALPGVLYYYRVQSLNSTATGGFSGFAVAGWSDIHGIINCDFDGDGKADPAVCQESTGTWGVKMSGNAYGLVIAERFLGGPGWSPAAADYDGDGKADPAVWQPVSGTWAVRTSAGAYALVTASNFLGEADCLAASADYDGDGKADPAVYQPATGTWAVKLSSSAYGLVVAPGFLGQSDCLPAAADYDGDGKADPAVIQPATGSWAVRMSGSDYALAFAGSYLGEPGDNSVAGDYDGDGRADPAVYQEATANWSFKLSASGYSFLELTGFLGVPAEP